MRNIFVFFGALLIVDGVFGDDVTLSVMEGDSVTLNPHTVIPEDDTAEWFFGKERIARMNKAAGIFSTSDGVDGRFKGKLELDHQTGSLTITNIRTNHAGLYKLQIRIRDATSDQTFKVTVSSGAVKSLSVMEGDTVTLHTGVTGIQRDEIQWKFGDPGVLIADLKGRDDTRWRNEIGDLTISNIQRNQSGDYELKINTSNMILHRKLHINFSGAVKSLSVMEGDTVTLHTGVTGIQRDQIQWLGDQGVLIADLKGPDDTRWRNEIGDLTFSNIRRNQSGDYELKINTSNMILHRKLRINFSGEMKPVSVKEGDTITLDTELKGYDLIMWKFKDYIIAEINKGSNRPLTHDTGAGGRFKGRLQLDNQSGSLTISDSRTTDSEDYHLNMSSDTYTIQRILIVTVSDSGLSSGAVAGIVVGLLLMFAAAAGVIYHRHKISKLQRSRDVNGTNDPLKVTANSDDL